MARLSLIRSAKRRKRIVVVLTMWLEMCSVVSSFLNFLAAIISLNTYRPKVRSYSLDFYSKREYVRRLVHENDESCISQLRMNRAAFFKLCEMLQHIGGLKSTRNMNIDEQVAMFLHIIAHHVKNRVIRHNFQRSSETISRHFHNVLNAVMHLQEHLFRKPEPIPTNSTDNRWKWFKNCLGALDGTHIRVKVPIEDKPRYRTRKGDIATNMLAVCTPELQFVYVLPGWEGSVADGRVLRDAISRRHGLKVPHVVEEDQINRIDPSDAWSNWRMELANQMFSEWQSTRGTNMFDIIYFFQAGYLNELERMLARKLPNANIKAKPHIESRIRTLKKDWAIVYDMAKGDNTSGFGWDSQRNMVTAEESVWESYLRSHKDASPFRTRSFHFFNELCQIYGKDCATGKDAQTARDIIEEIQTEGNDEGNDGRTTDFEYEDHNIHGSDDQEMSFAPRTSTSSKKRKVNEMNEPISAETLINATTILSENMTEIGNKLSRSIGTEMRPEERAEKLYNALDEINGLTEDEKEISLSKIPDHGSQMVVFFSLPPSQPLRWVRRFLATH
ncbi:hypothetical protein PTKIN_Ptkin06aG0110400 [Pterospermum kingtungense]